MQKEQQELANLIKGKKVAFIGAGVSHKTLIKEFVELGAHVTLCDQKKSVEDFGDYAATIKELGNVFTAQMQNLVSLCWDNAIAVGGPEKEKWESGAYAIEDITKFLILIDESHRWVNTSMPLILDMVTRYLREARKYFAGIVLASQSVRDYMPEGDFSGADNIRILFELCQYKFMFKQDSSAKEHIRRIFGEGMTFSQVESIPFLEQGENVLSIAGAGALQFRVWLSRDYEATLFSGGR